MDRAAWDRKVAGAADRLGLRDGYKMLYAPWAGIARARVVFLSLNPGVPPDRQHLRMISDERGDSYDVERQTSKSRITPQYFAFREFLGLGAGDVLPGVVNPFRSDSWDGLPDPARRLGLKLGAAFWAEVLARADIRLIVAVSAEAARVARTLTGARPVDSLPAGWGNQSIRVLESDRVRIVHLPHLSRFGLFGRPASDPFLKAAFRGWHKDAGGP